MSFDSGLLQTSPRPRTHFRGALADAFPFAFGMIPLGVAFGMLVVQTGLAWWWAPVFSALVFAGSLEFLLIGLVAAHASLVSIAMTTVLVNGRHVFYALSFPLSRVRGRAARLYSMFGLIDEAYALFAARESSTLTGRRIVYTQLALQSWWVGGALIGAIAGSIVRPLDGLEFALTSLFFVLAMDAVRERRSICDPLLALVCVGTAEVLAPGQSMVLAIGLYVALVLASADLSPV